VIGKNNDLPWHIKEDMIHFKTLTAGFPCIMGRKTWDSLPKKPLPGRRNIVITRTPEALKTKASEAMPFACEPETFFAVSSIKEALERCADAEKVFICGGASVYGAALPFADALEITLVKGEIEGDAFFPEIDFSQWKEAAREDHDSFSFLRYIKS